MLFSYLIETPVFPTDFHRYPLGGVVDEQMLVFGSERHGPGSSLPHTRTYRSNIRGDWSCKGVGVYTLPPHYGFTLIQSGLTDCGLTIQYQSYFKISRGIGRRLRYPSP